MKRLRLNLDLTVVIVLIAAGVLLPVMLATAVGIVALAIADDAGGIVTGVLVVSFAATALGSGLIAVVMTGRRLRLARRQADFLAGMSHEFRTPLSAIRLYTQTLQSGKLADDPGRIDACLATILRETEWLDVMIDHVLTWRASSRDLLPLDLVSQPVDAAVRAAAARFQAMVAPDGLSFSCANESRQPVAHDARALTAVVLNLLTNAFKYTGSDKQIALRTHDRGSQVVIEVQDNGVGLLPAQAKRVFQPFYRVEHPDGGARSGSGLGLAIAHHLVNRHRGSIQVESTAGRGSLFTVVLPAAEAPHA